MVVQEFIDKIYDDKIDVDFNFTLSKIRDLAKGIRKSTLRWEMFQQACKDVDITPRTIPLDIKVRWNSMLHMLEQAVYLRKPIARFLTQLSLDPPDRRDGPPFHERCAMTNQEWDLIEVLYVFLIPFKRVTMRFENHAKNPEIDYIYYAYDRMFNHIEDVLFSLRNPRALGRLPSAKVFVQALEDMRVKLNGYYDKTKVPFVYADAMILNPRNKLSIFKENTWSDIDCEPYVEACRRRYELEYKSMGTTSISTIPSKRPAPNDDDDDEEFHAMLNERAQQCPRADDYERYLSSDNNPSINSALGWWKTHHHEYPDLSKMVRDTLAVPASGCSVERMFSASGRIATWQRSRLHDTTISNLMMYKSVLNCKEPTTDLDASEELVVSEMAGKIPPEWENDWWKERLRVEVRPAIMRRFLEDTE